MLKPGGYAVITSPEPSQVRLGGFSCDAPAGVFEADTFSCAHCNRVTHVKPMAHDTDFYFCRQCFARICDPCADHPCIPFMKKIEMVEAKERARRSYGA